MANCDVVQDLIPLYNDEVASEGSRALVDEHVGNCSVCREILERAKDNYKAGNVNIDSIDINILKTIKRRIFKKIAFVTFSAVACTVIFLWIMFTWLISMPFDADNLMVHLDTGNLLYEGQSPYINPILEIRNNYHGVTLMQIGDELFVNYKTTIYTRFFDQNGQGRWYGVGDTILLPIMTYPDGNRNLYEIGDDINRIYYMHANYNKLYRLTIDEAAYDEAKAALEKAKQNAVLVWER